MSGIPNSAKSRPSPARRSTGHQGGFTLIEMLVALTVAISLLAVAATLIKRESTDIAATNTAEQLRVLGDAALLAIGATGEYRSSTDMSKSADAAPIAKYLPPNLASLTVSPFDHPYFVFVRGQGSGEGVLACTRVPSLGVGAKIASLLGVNGLYVSVRRDGTYAFSGVAGTLGQESPFSVRYLGMVRSELDLEPGAQPKGDQTAGRPSAVCYATSTTQAEMHKDKDAWLHRASEPGHEDWNRMNADIDMNGRNLTHVRQMSISLDDVAGGGKSSGATLGACTSMPESIDAILFAGKGICLALPKDSYLAVGGLKLFEKGFLGFSSPGTISVGGQCSALGQMTMGVGNKVLTCRRFDKGTALKWADSSGSPPVSLGNSVRDGHIEFNGGVGPNSFALKDIEASILLLGNTSPATGSSLPLRPDIPNEDRTFQIEKTIPANGAARNITVGLNLYPLSDHPEGLINMLDGAAKHPSVGNAVLLYAIERSSGYERVLNYQQCHFPLGFGTCHMTVRMSPGGSTIIRGVWGGISSANGDFYRSDSELVAIRQKTHAKFYFAMDEPFCNQEGVMTDMCHLDGQ
ncbi:type II secretion system protein [Pandoraea fibrosis]|uniref:Prepilin-type N-terminal cleavage/methylation domain-containing protein n=1 Tax=Pandoraea fibrosis TaxID=1891094 RepID=A0A5E4Z0E6_9BURK|nr:type II secretion system protein [Pandoraea fibrosis]VVE54157.1 hypothetical protein PFI31113_04879 [Pandoraea fibrosis]